MIYSSSSECLVTALYCTFCFLHLPPLLSFLTVVPFSSMNVHTVRLPPSLPPSLPPRLHLSAPPLPLSPSLCVCLLLACLYFSINLPIPSSPPSLSPSGSTNRYGLAFTSRTEPCSLFNRSHYNTPHARAHIHARAHTHIHSPPHFPSPPSLPPSLSPAPLPLPRSLSSFSPSPPYPFSLYLSLLLPLPPSPAAYLFMSTLFYFELSSFVQLPSLTSIDFRGFLSRSRSGRC